MASLKLPFFPFSYVQNGERHPGYAYVWPSQCDHCDRQCERPRSDRRLALCSYGVNYARLSPDLLVFGLVVSDYSEQSQARSKIAKHNRHLSVEKTAVSRAFQGIADFQGPFEAAVSAEKTRLVDEYRQSRQYEADFLGSLRGDLQRSLAVLHDYRQFVAQVRTNLNVILEARYPVRSLEDQLGIALEPEKAIYWACRIMSQKLEVAFLLLHPERVSDPNTFAQFRLHGAAHKYLQIYRPSFAQKNVHLRVVGESTGLVLGNPEAFGVIPHTFIDNALKYAPRGSEVVVAFTETPSSITLSVESKGPRIESDELTSIFDLFYRGRHAQRQEEMGTGFGLYLAQLVAIAMNTRISVTQDAAGTQNSGLRTRFSVDFDRVR